ncbi:MAG: cytochrome C oxidase subunit IV family protein [Flavobacteriales bacterium]|jgi:cytochrome c oxidase subunit 4|nr:cytochrome C oxidase subunit IV family protein [Flavobacteriales bacterium]MCI1751548.1 cytochrome C oxidase subunit IV family protein [Flavobacteriales bacterium]
MERDDIIEYSLDAGHSEEAGRVIRKKILFVTILLSVITSVEVMLGVYWRNWMPDSWHWVKWTFIVLTLVKATYIVMSFMHLGDERRNIRSVILLPYALFLLYLTFIAIWESTYIHETLKMFL